MKVTVNKDRCKECGLCIHHCPRKAISKCDVLNAKVTIRSRWTTRRVLPAECATSHVRTAYSTYQEIQKGRLNDSWQR